MKNNAKNYNISSANPLNLRDNYNDNVFAFKVLLNLSNDDEIKILGQQIVDSYMLLSLIQNNKMLSQISNYNVLIDKLSLTINKYSKFEKILRNKNVYTKGFLSNSYMFNVDVKDRFQFVSVNSLKAIKSKKSYICVNKDSYEYSLNDILEYSNLLKRVLCKDKEQVFLKQVHDSALNKVDIKTSLNTNSIIKKKNRLLRKTISSDNYISNSQYLLFDRINNLYKKLVYLEYQIYSFEKCNTTFNSRLLILEPNVVDEYKKFLEECKDVYTKAIRERNFVYENLNTFLNEYEQLMKNKDNHNDKSVSNIKYNEALNRDRKAAVKSYIFDRINNKDGKRISFISYLKNNYNNKELIEQETNNNTKYLSMYSSYLIYKSGVPEGHNAIPFEKFANDIYGVERVDPIYSLKI